MYRTDLSGRLYPPNTTRVVREVSSPLNGISSKEYIDLLSLTGYTSVNRTLCEDTPSYDIFRKTCRLDHWVFFSISNSLRLVYMMERKTEARAWLAYVLSMGCFLNHSLKVCAINLKLVSQLQRATVGECPLKERLSRIIDEMHFSHFFPPWSLRWCIFKISDFWQWQNLIFLENLKNFQYLIFFSVIRKASFWRMVQSVYYSNLLHHSWIFSGSWFCKCLPLLRKSLIYMTSTQLF